MRSTLYALPGGGEKHPGLPTTLSYHLAQGSSRLSRLPAELRAVLRKDSADVYREALYQDIRSRFGQAAADHLVTRLLFASPQQVITWARRAPYRISYPALLEPEPLAVQYISPAGLLLHAFGNPVPSGALLVRFSRSRDEEDDRRFLLQCVPWLPDLPQPDLAITRLRLRGWLLFVCEPGQADLLERTTLQRRRLSAVHLDPGQTAGLTELEVERLYLPSLFQDGFDKCLR